MKTKVIIEEDYVSMIYLKVIHLKWLQKRHTTLGRSMRDEDAQIL
jgi:hypothetical protein